MNTLPPAQIDVSVLILFFNRADVLEKVFAEVKKARPARLFLYQDGPRGERDMPGILACREVVSQVDWQCEVHTMYQEKNYGCDPKNIRAAIGPNIGPCCFACDADVPDAMVHGLGDAALAWVSACNGKYYVNLKEINAQFLRNAGVCHIEISTDCTMCQPNRFWSHRVTKGARGSQGAVIVCQGGKS